MSEKEKKDIKIINDDGSNIVVSPVYGHISAAKPKGKSCNPKNIIVPNEKKIIRKTSDKK